MRAPSPHLPPFNDDESDPRRCNTTILCPLICARIAHSSLISRLSHTALASYGLDGKRDHGACVGLTSCVVCGACACGCRSVVCSCVVLCTWLGWCWVTSPRRSVQGRFIVQPRHQRMGHGGRDEHGPKCVRPLRISPPSTTTRAIRDDATRPFSAPSYAHALRTQA